MNITMTLRSVLRQCMTAPRIRRRLALLSCLLAGAGVLAGCALVGGASVSPSAANQAIRASFRDQGIAKLSRMDQDLMQAACSSPQDPSDDVAERIRYEAMLAMRWPTGGQYFGNWQAGERLAQDGRGMTWTDRTTDTKSNGGNCYNCHQIDQKELSYGTIGPSLWQYGKNRGVKDLNDPNAAPIIQYTWAKLWNSAAFAACSQMPRFGHKGLLDEAQIRDLMSLLLDPRSPVNQ